MEFELKETVALLSFDDGKANAVGHDFLDAMNAGLDRAEKEAQAVVIQGRTGVLSGGFDLKEFKKGAEASAQLINKGAHTLLRLFSHPQPVVIACCGHAIAAGGFLLLTADNRIGGAGDFKGDQVRGFGFAQQTPHIQFRRRHFKRHRRNLAAGVNRGGELHRAAGHGQGHGLQAQAAIPQRRDGRNIDSIRCIYGE